MTDRIRMVCIEIAPQDGYQVVLFAIQAVDQTIYASQTYGIQFPPEEEFTLNASYGLDLQVIEYNVLTEEQLQALGYGTTNQ